MRVLSRLVGALTVVSPIVAFCLIVFAGVDLGVGFLAGVLGMLVPGSVMRLVVAVLGYREGNRLWRQRMASGYYKTLPLPLDDDDDW